MKFQETALPGVLVIEPAVYPDDRGCFFDAFHHDVFAAAGLPTTFHQDSQSHSKKHVLRGLHYQYPVMQGKLVRVAHGAIFDVVVDIRKGSPTFAQWIGLDIDDTNKLMLWVPEGFAHGFVVQSENADVLYKMTAAYAPGQSRAIRWDDPDIGIQWPSNDTIISAADSSAPLLTESDLLPEYKG